jgi:hypothetical protein
MSEVLVNHSQAPLPCKEKAIINVIDNNTYWFTDDVKRGILYFTRKHPVFAIEDFMRFCDILKKQFKEYGFDSVNKLSSLNYIYTVNDGNIYRSLADNVDVLSTAFGASTFLKRDTNPIQWNKLDNHWFYVSCTGGAWAGTFSIDLSLGCINVQETWVNPLVHVSFDTVLIGNERVGRIIRAGRVIKDGGYKLAMADKYTTLYKNSPEAYLCQIAVRLLSDLGINRILWISTEWAGKYSSLAKSKGWFDYNRLMEGSGFIGLEWEAYWKELNFNDSNWYIYHAKNTSRHRNSPINSHFDAFDDTEPVQYFLLQNTQTHTRDKVKLLIASSIIVWASQFGWNHWDLK